MADIAVMDMKAAARRMLAEIFPAVDEAALVEIVSDRFVNHEAPPGPPPSPGSVSYFMHPLAKAFSEQRWTIDKVIAEGDRVALHCTHTGRHTGEFFPLPATGRAFSCRQMHMIRFEQGHERRTLGGARRCHAHAPAHRSGRSPSGLTTSPIQAPRPAWSCREDRHRWSEINCRITSFAGPPRGTGFRSSAAGPSRWSVPRPGEPSGQLP